ncbi:nicotinate-nucleotide adenylyltransferase [Phenylobacterium montanum]|uniref:Probable nicotinate-nucleotide adenylyltransferase n=1 Tax=Phenylobacterium montanum TaxID=2823693 RepID=A0A975IUS4_9CAUL|nr:nicotinate-nucleotide adenylyltransferase [Caulobacter sp. S6]QUD86551.1 nicotinate-nucleotide adenylyltransferase [Caulobacter sp. S6]
MWFAGPVRRVPEAGRPDALRLGFSLQPGMRVGLFGGSFNPAHEGHAHVAETALTRLGLDRVIWLVSPQNPLKTAQPDSLRMRMAKAARFARGPKMIVSDIETRLGVRYTIDLIRILQARFPGVKFVWIMGADSLASFHRWRGWSEIQANIPIAVVSRPGSELRGGLAPAARRFAAARRPAGFARRLATTDPPAWVYIPAQLNHASSTKIRDAKVASEIHA